MNSSLDDSLDVSSPDVDKELAHSFRKRRLTYSKHHIDMSDSDTNEIDHKIAAASGEKRKRDDDNTTSSPTERIEECLTSSIDDSLQKRILHAGEITEQSHQKSSHFAPKSKWHQRFSFSGAAPDTALPFPRHVVGTYSCHGMEPVYDSDYEHDDSSDDGKQQQESIAKINQDRGGVAYPYANSEYCALFAVYDGHGEGGEMVSQYALGEVQRLLEKELLGLRSGCGNVLDAIGEDEATNNENLISTKQNVISTQEEDILIQRLFQETFVKVDRGLLKESEIEPMYSGTTACVALLRQKKLYISNAGDSRAVLARRSIMCAKRTNGKAFNANDATKAPNLTTIPLSKDQNPDSPGEQERILNAGGFVSLPPEPGLSARVWLDDQCTQIGLAMARSIGDHAVKDVGVIAEPVVTVYDVAEEDEFMILATDGVWEFIDSEDAVQIVSKHLYGKDANGDGKKCASKACEALIKAAMEKWHEYEGDYRDDITAIVVQLKDIWDYH